MMRNKEMTMNTRFEFHEKEMTQRMTAMRMQMNAMDDMMRDENGMSTEDSFGFHAAVQAMFDAADAFDDWMMQEKKFGNK
jgi:hypothetical protein